MQSMNSCFASEIDNPGHAYLVACKVPVQPLFEARFKCIATACLNS